MSKVDCGFVEELTDYATPGGGGRGKHASPGGEGRGQCSY